MIAIVKLALVASMFMLVLSLGLRVTLAELRGELAHPGVVVRSMFAIGVAMPLATLLAVRVLPLEPVVAATLVALSMSPLPPGLLLKHGRVEAGGAYTAALLLVLGACAIVLIPGWLAVARQVAERGEELPVETIARVVGVGLLLPVLLGLAMRAARPALAERLAWPLHRTAVVIVLLLLVPLLWVAGPAMWRLVGNGSLAALAGFTIVGMLVGHLLGGTDPRRRAALALATGGRHPAMAFAVATAGTMPREPVLGAVVWHLLLAALLALPYIAWQKRRVARAAASIS